MGQKRIKVVTETPDTKSKKAKKEKQKTSKVPGLKGGQRVVMVTSEAPAEKKKPTVEKKVKPEVTPLKERLPKKRGQAGRGKRYQRAKAKLKKGYLYPLAEALDKIRQTSITRFDGMVEAHLTLKEDEKSAKGKVKLPHGTGKELTILVFGSSKKADLVGSDKLLVKIEAGKTPKVDIVLATPEWMPKLAKVAKFLGPKGLMPNPKTGTVTEEPDKVIKEVREGAIIYQTDPSSPVIHLGIGRVSWEGKKLKENLMALINAVGSQRVTKLSLSSTMGPGVKVQLS
jgi:large subunit ribosomal protein L1